MTSRTYGRDRRFIRNGYKNRKHLGVSLTKNPMRLPAGRALGRGGGGGGAGTRALEGPAPHACATPVPV